MRNHNGKDDRVLYNDIIHVLLSEWCRDKNGLNDFYNVFTLSKCLNMQDFDELLRTEGALVYEDARRED